MKSFFQQWVWAASVSLLGLTSSLSVQAAMLEPAQLRGKKVLFVTGEESKERPSDDKLIQAYLTQAGMVVTPAKDNEPASRARGQDLIVISSTVNSRVLKDTYQTAPVPIFTWSAFSYPFLAMTGPVDRSDFEVLFTGISGQLFRRNIADGYAYCTNAANPIAKAAGIPNLLFAFCGLSEGKSWGKPLASADTVVTFEGDDSKAAVFTYEKGATMSGGMTAPARRVGFGMHHDTFHTLSRVYGFQAKDPNNYAWFAGLRLFEAALRWAVSPPDVPPASDQLHAALAKAAKGKKIVFVERYNFPEGKEADDHNVAYLRELGFTVVARDAEDPEMPVDDVAIVELSATISKLGFGQKYWNTKAAVMCHEGLYSDSMRFTSRKRFVDYGEHGEWSKNEDDNLEENYLEIINSGHPLAGGLPPGLFKFTQSPGTIKWGTPLPGGVAIATLPNAPQQSAIYGYEAGATMGDGFVAPARRVMFNLDNPAFDDLTDQGRVLYDASLLWLISGSHPAS
jgi:hypothetical protein